ncbi:MAG: amidohydrolase family protein, partial [Pseudomonas sp.]
MNRKLDQYTMYAVTLQASGAGANVRTVFFHQTRHHVLEDRPVELDAAISDFLAERELRDFRPAPEGAAASTSPLIVGLLALALVTPTVAAQRPTLANAVRPFVAVDTSAVALTHVRVIDGTGAAPKTDQTIMIRDGRIASIGNSAATQVPAGTLIMNLTGKSVIPGLVLVHEHLHYPTGPGVYGNVTESFSRLYLAGGVTSMRTAGSVNGIADVRLKKAIDAGARAGPWLDATAPYLEGSPGLNLNQFYELRNAADARRHIEY